MKVTIEISPEEVVELMKGNVELTAKISEEISKAVVSQMTQTTPPEWWNWWKK